MSFEISIICNHATLIRAIAYSWTTNGIDIRYYFTKVTNFHLTEL